MKLPPVPLSDRVLIHSVAVFSFCRCDFFGDALSEEIRSMGGHLEVAGGRSCATGIERDVNRPVRGYALSLGSLNIDHMIGNLLIDEYVAPPGLSSSNLCLASRSCIRPSGKLGSLPRIVLAAVVKYLLQDWEGVYVTIEVSA